MVFLPETAVFWYKEDRTWEPGCNCLIDRTDSLENFNFSMFWSESALRDHKIQLSLSTGSEKKKSFFFSTHCNLIDKVFLSRFFGGVFGGRLGQPSPRIMAQGFSSWRRGSVVMRKSRFGGYVLAKRIKRRSGTYFQKYW